MDEKRFELVKKDLENLVYHRIISEEMAEEILEKVRKKYFNS